MQQLANDYNIKGSFEGISFINCMFEYEPNIEKNGFHKIVFEKCIFLGIQTDLTKHLLSNIDEQRRRILFDECKFDNFQLGDITDIQYKQNVELCKFDFFGGEIENLNIENIEIASKFYINKQYGANNKPTKIKELIIDSSIFT
ncbi:MAG TPA: hypothetical protein EYH01_06050, partial [Campylobacterales bacterium]|nr:hypothetical protein [Campylobacterales bacterium]